MTDSPIRPSIISSELPVNGLAEADKDDAESWVELAPAEWRGVSVPVELHAHRLDRALAAAVPEFSRSYLQQLILGGSVTVNGVEQTKAAVKVKAGDALAVELKPTPQSQAFKPESMRIDVVYEDDFLLVLNKPAGLVVHPAPGNWSGTLLNGLLARDSQASFLPRAGIVHRLDKDTSGLMMVARQRKTMDDLVKMIAARTVSRQYLAVAHKAWSGAKNKNVALPIGRDPKNRLRMAVVDLEKNAGKIAETDVLVLASNRDFCFVQCKLRTGRTHQIRVHMAALGHPLVGDTLYGGQFAGSMQRQALHAYRLAFEHPVSGAPMQFEAELPPDMTTALAELGLR